MVDSLSERLPKENEEVLITLIHGKVTWAYLHQGEWYNMFATYPIERNSMATITRTI